MYDFHVDMYKKQYNQIKFMFFIARISCNGREAQNYLMQ